MRIAGMLALLLVSVQVQAGVIYNWENITTNPTAGNLIGHLELEDGLWTLGGSVAGGGSGFWPIGSAAPFGIKEFYLTAVNGYDPIQLQIFPCAGAGCPPGGKRISDGYFTFYIGFGEQLSGSLYANDVYSDVRMSGGPNIWTVSWLASDDGPCMQSPYCAGGTGTWNLDYYSVPEPATTALFILGAAGIAFSRRRTR